MENESIYDVSSVDSLEADSIAEQDPAEQTEPEEQEPPEPIDQGSADSSPGFSDSSPEAVTPVSSVSVTMDNSDILYRMERLEGRQVSLLYTQYILISLLISGFIIKMIFHFTSFDR